MPSVLPMGSRADRRRAKIVENKDFAARKEEQKSRHHGATEFEEQAVLHDMMHNKAGDELLNDFFIWLVPPGWWPEFWARFRADGILTWQEFEDFVHWEGRWTSNTSKVFEELAAHCGTCRDNPHLTTSGLWDLKVWWGAKYNKGRRGIDNFKLMFAERFGNLGRAWRECLDPEESGSCCFLHFCRQCNRLGLRVHLKSAWEELTDGRTHRNMTYVDWDLVGDRLVSRFVMSLCIKYGGLRSGWDTLIKNAGGHLARSEFVEATIGFGIARHESEWLFEVLDIERRKYLSEFDRLRFLQHWDPGTVRHMSMMDLKFATHVPPQKSSVQAGRARDLGQYEETPFDVASDNPYQILLVLTKGELLEYKRRQRSERLAMGLAGEVSMKNLSLTG